MTIEDRLNQLVKENRRLKRMFAFGAVVIVVIACTGAAGLGDLLVQGKIEINDGKPTTVPTVLTPDGNATVGKDLTVNGDLKVKGTVDSGLVCRSLQIKNSDGSKTIVEVTERGEVTITGVLKVNGQDVGQELEELETKAIKFGSSIRLQVKDKNMIVGTAGGADKDGTAVNVGPRDDNDNWFTVIQRPAK